MKKIQPNNNIASKFLNGIVTKVNAIIDKLIVDVKVNGTSVVTVNEDGEREADIDLSVSDQNVKQSPTTDNADYRILLSKSANDTEETDISRKNTNFKYNPFTGNLQVSKVNGNTVPSGSGNDTLAKTSDIPDMTNYIQKSLTVGLIKNDGTIDQTQYATMSDIPDELADLADDVNHRLVTDAEKSTWNDKRAVNLELTNEDLDDVKTVGFYVAKNGNTCANKPSGFNQFGLYVIRTATSGTGNYYKQILIRPNASGETWSRSCVNGTWSAWTKEITTDENVKQSPFASPIPNANYPLLIANSANGTEETQTVWKDTNLTYNPSTQVLNSYYGQFVSCLVGTIDFGISPSDIKSSLHRSLSSSHVDVWLPEESGTLALQSELPTEAVEWSEMNVLGAKNLLPYNPYNPNGYVQNGITFTVTEEGYVIANGTKTTASNNSTFNISERYENTGLFLPNGTYKLTGCPSGGSNTTYQIGVAYYNSSGTYTTIGNDNGEGLEFTINGSQYSDKGAWVRVYIVLRGGYSTANNLTFKPMIRLASISDSTYKSPSNTNRQLTLNKLSWEENKASGVKNYFPYPYYLHPLQGETYTQRGIQWTDNGDRGIKANGNNDNTGNSYCQLMPTSLQSGVHFCKLPQGKYHFSGGISSDYYMNLSTGLETSPTDRTVIDYDYGNGFDFEVTEAQARDNIFCSFAFVLKGKTANNVVFYPMITRYEDSSQGYAEYAMTNAELTQFKADMDNIAPTETSGESAHAYAVGDYMWWRHGFYRVTQAIAVGDSITTSKVTKTTLGAELKRALT